jgi:hypothetical protein
VLNRLPTKVTEQLPYVLVTVHAYLAEYGLSLSNFESEQLATVFEVLSAKPKHG